LEGVAQAEHDLRRQFEIAEDMMPDWHQAHRARICEAEIAIAHSLLKKGDDLAPYVTDTPIRPPCHRQCEIVKGSKIGTVEKPENSVVKLDDLPPLPLVTGARGVRRNLIGNINPHRA
jgi:hypothetical protein